MPTFDAETRYRFVIQALDTELGRFLNAISWDTTLKNTTVLFLLSDNGSPTEVAHFPVKPQFAKGTVGQGGVRVPFWIGGKGVPAGEVPEGQLATAADIYATILDLAGPQEPESHSKYADDSKTLVPFFSNPQAGVRQGAFTETFIPNKDPEGPVPLTHGQFAVRDTRYKCIRTLAGQEAFYDLQEDPWEDNNLLSGTLTPAQQTAREECNTTMDEILGVCTLAEQGEPCVVDSDCCTGVCQGPTGSRVCTDLL